MTKEENYKYVTVEENMYIVKNMVQKHKGETIWLETKKEADTGRVLSTMKVVYIPMPNNKNCKRIYI
jgi:hypothetical protein